MDITVKKYSKTIKDKEVLKDINYEFHSGKIYGLHGRNGCGKTMLLRAISGLIYPTSGEIVIDGKVLHQDISFPESIGVIIENISLLPNLTALDNLKVIAKIKNIASEEDMKEALTKVGLDPDDKRKYKEYSLGMKQKVAIAQAIFEKPQIILLDEPTNALDQESVEDIRRVFLKLKDEGALIIIASHNLDDIKILNDEVIEMKDGKIVIKTEKKD